MNKKIIILISMVIIAYTVIGVVLYNMVDIEVMTVDMYSSDNKWVIGNTKVLDENNKEYTRYFCTPNDKDYKIGDKIIVVHNEDELFQFNIFSW